MNNEVNEGRGEVGHRVLPQTAGVIVEAWSPSRSGCLEELVRGVVSIFADAGSVRATREVPLEVTVARDEDVVVAVLEDVCQLLYADELVVADVALNEEEDGCFEGTFFVVPADAVIPTGAVPKGVSRSDVLFAREGSSWRGRVLVDE
jgi:SHS2 domain-containing protein